MRTIQDVLLGRCTVHDYATGEVPSQVLLRAVRAALAAPCHRMTEPWRFTQVGPVMRARLAELAVQLKAGNSSAPLRDDVVEKTRAKILKPSELLVVSRVRHPDEDVAREDYAAVACAIENLCLSLWSDGVGSKWGTGEVTRAAQTYHLLQIDPELEEIAGFVWIGYPAGAVSKARRRLGIDEVLRTLP